MKLLQTYVDRLLCERKSSFLWDRCPSLFLLGCFIVACLVFKEIAKLFCRVAVPLYILANDVSQFLLVLFLF